MGTMTVLLALALGLAFLLVAGCAALIPDAIRPEVTHESHVLQHFGDHPTNYGDSRVGVTGVWRRGPWVTEIGESYDLNKPYAPGCAAGCRDVFSAQFGYEIPLGH
ncbi:MAG TPA: hypothetical protein VMH26_09390 [Burkholderiales bacterium]|nr:hypothetical protein [Burkholderiales bacterium]